MRRLLLALAAACLVAGCGGGSGESAISTTTPPTTVAASTTTSAPPVTTTTTTTTIVFTDPYGFVQHPNTPLIEPGSWDSTWTAVPHVLQDGDRWLMFYSGGVGGQSSELGLAQSPDGLVWEKITESESLLKGGGPGVAWNYAQNTGDQWELWYVLGFGNSYQRINHATAPAPEGPWEVDNLSIDAPGDEWNERVLPTGFVQIDGTYFMPYAGFPDRGSRPAIGLFTSTDGQTWESTPEPIHTATKDTWDEYGVVPSNVFETPNGLEMLFIGFDRRLTVSREPTSLKLGRLISSDGGATWVLDNDGLPVIDTFERGWPGLSVVFTDGEYRIYLGHELGFAGIALVTGTIE